MKSNHTGEDFDTQRYFIILWLRTVQKNALTLFQQACIR